MRLTNLALPPSKAVKDSNEEIDVTVLYHYSNMWLINVINVVLICDSVCFVVYLLFKYQQC